MKLPAKSAKQKKINIRDYYEVNLKSLWYGFKQEGAALWWLCIYLLFEYIRPQSLYPVIDILPWSQIALMLSCYYAFTDKRVKWVRNPGSSLFILLLFVIVLSSVLAFRPSTSFGKLEIVVGWIIFYYLIISVVNTEKRFIIFLLFFFLANFKMSQYGARDFLTGGYNRFGVSGSPGWFKDSGDLGIEMTIFVSLAVSFVFALKQYWGIYKKLLLYLMPFTGLLTLIATSSRGAQLGMVAAGIWFMLINRQVKALLGVLIVGGLLYAILPAQMLEEFQAAGDDSTSQTRLALWKYGLDVVIDKPVLGVGYHNWLDYCWFKHPDGFEGVKHCLVPHNSYVTVSSETGITGLVVYLSLMIYIFVENRRTRVNAKKLDNRFIMFTAYGLDGGLLAYMVSTVFFSVTWYPMLYVQLAMTVALFEISKKQVAEIRKIKIQK